MPKTKTKSVMKRREADKKRKRESRDGETADDRTVRLETMRQYEVKTHEMEEPGERTE